MQTLSIQKEDKQQRKNTLQRNCKMKRDDNADGDDDKLCSHTQAETEHDNNYHQSKKVDENQHQCSMGIKLRKQSRTQTTAIELSPSPKQQITSTFKKTRQQCLESIKLSYLVLGASCIECSPQKRPQRLKKSFIATNEQQHSPKITITKQSLKSPLNIDIKKLQFSSTSTKKKLSDYFNDLSEQLFLFNLGTKRWQRSHMEVDGQKKELIVSSFHVPLMTIEKLKIFKPNKEENMREVKVTYTAGSEMASLFMNIGEGKSIKKPSIDYVIFQQILTQKLANQNTIKQTKWTKQPHICEQVIYSSYIFGEIYKKSQYFGKWEKRYIVLNGEGVFSYRSAVKKEDCSFFIQRRSIEYLWTRFDMIDNFLIIKVKHGMKQTQFGIPVTNYSNPHFKNWLYYFYKLMDTD